MAPTRTRRGRRPLAQISIPQTPRTEARLHQQRVGPLAREIEERQSNQNLQVLNPALPNSTLTREHYNMMGLIDPNTNRAREIDHGNPDNIDGSMSLLPRPPIRPDPIDFGYHSSMSTTTPPPLALTSEALQQDRVEHRLQGHTRMEYASCQYQAPRPTAVAQRTVFPYTDHLQHRSNSSQRFVLRASDISGLNSLQSFDPQDRGGIAHEVWLENEMTSLMVVSNNYRDRDRAKSCRNQFRAKQKLWKDWCEEKGYPDHDRVSPGKLAVFLEQEVFPKGNRSKGKRNGLALSEQGIEGYIKPIVDLWETQTRLGLFANPEHPRNGHVNTLVKHYLQTRREEFYRRGFDPSLDTIKRFGGMNELERTLEMLFKSGGYVDMRTRMDLLWGTMMMLRSQDRLNATFPDLFTVDAIGESQLRDSFGNKGNVPMLLLRLRQGKTNKEDKAQYGVVFRHKRLELCSVSGMAFYFFYRYHLSSQPWPDFDEIPDSDNDSPGWYKLRVFAKEEDGFEAITYTSHKNVCNNAFRRADCQILTGTHVCRREGCKLADALEIDDSSMRRLGRWDHSRMTQHYSSGIPRRGARELAGHGADEGHYFLIRESVEPSEELQRQIFPNLEYSEHLDLQKPPKDRDISLQGFFVVLRWFRTVILQDAVFLRQRYPDADIWNHHPFNSPDFARFSAELLHEAENGRNPHAVRVEQTVPLIANRIHEQTTQVTSVLRTNANMITAKLDEIHQKLEPLDEVHQFCTAMTINGLHLRVADAPSTQVASNSTASQLPPSQSAQLPSSSESAIPEYDMCIESVKTVERLWEEYDKGISRSIGAPRGPAIRMLDQQYSGRWRVGETKRKQYQRRRFVWEAVMQASENLQMSPVVIAQKMDRYMENKKISSLNKLNDMLKDVSGNKIDPLWGVNDIELRNIV